MNLYRLARARAADGRPIGVGLIGAGKFGAMFLAQARHCDGLRVAAIGDLRVAAARETLRRTGGRRRRSRRSVSPRTPGRSSPPTRSRW